MKKYESFKNNYLNVFQSLAGQVKYYHYTMFEFHLAVFESQFLFQFTFASLGSLSPLPHKIWNNSFSREWTAFLVS